MKDIQSELLTQKLQIAKWLIFSFLDCILILAILYTRLADQFKIFNDTFQMSAFVVLISGLIYCIQQLHFAKIFKGEVERDVILNRENQVSQQRHQSFNLILILLLQVQVQTNTRNSNFLRPALSLLQFKRKLIRYKSECQTPRIGSSKKQFQGYSHNTRKLKEKLITIQCRTKCAMRKTTRDVARYTTTNFTISSTIEGFFRISGFQQHHEYVKQRMEEYLNQPNIKLHVQKNQFPGDSNIIMHIFFKCLQNLTGDKTQFYLNSEKRNEINFKQINSCEYNLQVQDEVWPAQKGVYNCFSVIALWAFAVRREYKDMFHGSDFSRITSKIITS